MAPESPSEAGVLRFAAMGTRVELHSFDGGDADTLAAARGAVAAVDDALTIHRPSSATALNDALMAGRAAAVDDPLLLEALAIADAAHGATLGLFDTAADARTGARWPMLEIDAGRATVRAERPLALDFGGLGKGIALDHALATLRGGGVRSALATLGESSIGTIGDHPLGGGWPFAIPHPDDPAVELVQVTLGDTMLSVSATTGAGATVAGRAAMVRPADGRVVDTPRCAVAVSTSGAMAEAVSTALIVADADEAARLIDGDPGRRWRLDLGSLCFGPVQKVLA